ncbi:SpoIIE family protein phosphatase [Streptomyces eurocidicus]|nr:SpoIIE family protein phosphatase [Streptomyces eurocidicus]
MEHAFTQAPIAMALYDRDCRQLRANDEMAYVSGRPEDETRGRLLTELLPDPPLNELARLGPRVLRSGRPARADLRATVPGEQRERAWTTFLTPVKDDAGRTHGLAAAALDTTREYLARRRLSLVNEATARIGTTLDLTRTAQELTDVTCGRFADAVTVDLLASVLTDARSEGEAPTELRRVARCATHGTPPAPCPANGTIPLAPRSLPARVLASGRAARFHLDGRAGPCRWSAGALTFDECARGDGIHSVLAVPLKARGQVLGLAQFARGRSSGPFDEDDVLVAEDITARAATCIDNARRYTRERAVAVTLQHSLLPARPAAQNAVDVASRYLPACTEAGVGGDWFDVIPLSGTRVALVVGDVVGHGLYASATMGRLRTAVRTLADLDMPPDELLTHLDDLVLQNQREQHDPGVPGPFDELCATCLYVVYDSLTRRCVMASAGHPAPVLLAPDGTAGFLDLPHGPPLGLGGLPFESCEVPLPEGSVLALYTDGLVESADHDIRHGGDRLLRAMTGAAGSLEETCDTVLDALLPEKPGDDVALLLARTRALPADRTRAWDLASAPSAVADARTLATRQLTAWGLADLAFTTELVVSELVTNAIRYGAGPVRLRLIHDTRLICEVSDAGHTAPRLRRARTYDEGGRGLFLVAQLTDRWGTRYTSDGKTIWAEQLPTA